MSELMVSKNEVEPDEMPEFNLSLAEDGEQNTALAQHRLWLKSIRHERPRPKHSFKVAVYIRYFNQTRYKDYLSFHKQQFMDTINLCPNWKFVDFYVDEGATAPNMETAEAWSTLLQDCYEGKVDLIITQKASNISRKQNELAFCSRLLAALEHPVGIYFISEDIYTLASYYMDDLRDPGFLPSPDWVLLDDGETPVRKAIEE